MWFEQLTGFKEESPDQVRANLYVEGEHLISRVNNAAFSYGRLDQPSLEELRRTVLLDPLNGHIKLSEVVADVQKLHTLPENNGATFQVASQFNLLEMASPDVTPEQGVNGYYFDKTQGPACAIACGAGTIYRNYFVDLGTQIGQTAHKQIDCLSDVGAILNNRERKLWAMTNGYALATSEGLKSISRELSGLTETDYEALKGKLRIGVQNNAEVTISADKIKVSQCYCSALPVGYSNIPALQWEAFSRFVLEATYEATFYAALQNFKKTGNKRLFLTLVGGGVFGNKSEWIFDAIGLALSRFAKAPLDVKIVSYGASNGQVQDFIAARRD
ncbi:hypothetical protein [Geofilum rhodophaeum]|uniref:hypothetical protein n=1 Tax=Geofilum rhodophaeum TaxID=1965019 RepID=UPI000B5249AD|nr:hypothetical protein [Geofilum rhodophaeum]